MSENSSSQPYYLKYRELGWLDRPLSEAPDFFSEDTVRRICRLAGGGDDVDHARLAEELQAIAKAYWIAAMSSPLGIFEGPPSQRIDDRKRKIASTIVRPAERLIEALSDDNLPLLSEWPDEPMSPSPDRQVLLDNLGLLVDRARELSELLDDRKAKGSPLSREFKIDLANALTIVFERHFPAVRAARSGYDRKAQPVSQYRAYLNECAKAIFGEAYSLSDEAVDQVSKLRGNR